MKRIAINPRYARFAQEYAVDGDGQAAAIRAGFPPKGAKSKASQLLARPEVKAEIERFVAQRAEKTGVKLDRVLEELALIAFIDPKDFYDADGDLLPVPQMPEHARRALASVEIDNEKSVGRGESKIVTWTSKVKFEKRAALAELLDYLRPVKKVQLEGADGEPITIQVVNYAASRAK